MFLLLLIPVALILLLWTVSSSATAPAWLREATRMVLLVVLGFCVVGFGLCGAAGAFLGLALAVQGGDSSGLFVVVPSVAGLLVALGAYKLRVRVGRGSADPKGLRK